MRPLTLDRKSVTLTIDKYILEANSMTPFMNADFLLKTETARKLYHQHAERMPIIDYHCHINPQEIYEDKRYESITQVWLGGDHYKWRAMRSSGVPEYYITRKAMKLASSSRAIPL